MAKKAKNGRKHNLAGWLFSWLADHALEVVMVAILSPILAVWAGVKVWLANLPWSDIGNWMMLALVATMVVPRVAV